MTSVELNNPTSAPILDEIIYLASLASLRDEISPLMDPVRVITAKAGAGNKLSSNNGRKLGEVKAKLLDYLINKDPVRKFTPESLQMSIREHFAKRSYRPIVQLVAIVALSIIIGALSLLLPAADFQAKAVRVLNFILAVLPLGGAYFFVTSIPTFKAGIRRAYGLIAMGMILLGLAQTAQPIITIILNMIWPAQNSFTDKVGMSMIEVVFIIPATVLMYLGTRAYAKQLEVPHRFASTKLVGLMLLGATIVSIVFIVLLRTNDIMTCIITLAQGYVAILSLCSALIMHRMMAKTALIYSRASKALSVSFAVSVLTSLYMYIYLPVYSTHAGSSAGLLPVLAMLAINTIFILRSGYLLAKASRY